MTDILSAADLLLIEETTQQTYGTSIEDLKLYRLGKLLPDGSVETLVPKPEVPGMVWIRSPGDAPGDAIPAINTALRNDELIPNSFVLVKSYGRHSEIIKRAPEDEYFTEAIETPAQLVIDQSQINWGLLRPTSPPSMRCLVTAAVRWDGDTLRFADDLLTKNFTSDIPGSNAVGVFIEIDPVTNTFHYFSGTSFSTSLNLKEAFSDHLVKTLSDEGHFPVGYVKLYAGQTEIGRSEVAAVRGLISRGSGGGGTSFANAYFMYPGEHYYFLDGTLVESE